MSLIQVIYNSVAAPGLSEVEILDILKQSQGNNQGRKVSGLLFHRNRRFVQLLAGSEMDVMDLYGRIARDPRHNQVSIIRRGATDRGSMPTWAMAYFSPAVPEAARKEHAFILCEEDARRLCEALPASFGAPFLEMLDAERGAPA